MEKKISITYESSLKNIVSINPSFDLGILKVAYTGLNRNNSFISEETFEKCIKSIYNCPVVCNYNRETNSIGSHDIEIISNGDNNYKIINITQPVGVVPESAKYWWEDIVDNGVNHRYLCVEVLLWKRQEAYEHIKDNKVIEHSMEIDVVNGGFSKEGYYNITEFIFTAFCLLESAEPCFESSALHMFSIDDFKEQYSLMMKELKEITFNSQSSNEVDIKEIGKEDVILEDTTNIIVEETIDIKNEEVVVEINTPDVPNEVIINETTEVVEDVIETVENVEIVEETIETQPELIEKAEYSKLQSEFEIYKQEYSTPNTEVADLRIFKENTIKEKYELNVSNLFEKFDEELSDMESYKNFKSNYSQLSIDEIEEKLFALLGKKNANFSTKLTKENVVKVVFDNTTKTEPIDPYGGLLAKHYND